MAKENFRIESENDVKSYLQNLKYALEHGARINLQKERLVDQERDIKFSNTYTIAKLFPNQNPIVALRRELKKLTVEEYIATVKDLRFSERSEMREFGRIYNGEEDVYIKIRVELLGDNGNHTAFVMSFHFAVVNFSDEMFPYKRGKG
ncbi:MAG: hypothetical protein Q4D21_04380 [Phascolarctobacterium sp.]|nr:hypothetical protein [Phascolarctobacterium sp.]